MARDKSDDCGSKTGSTEAKRLEKSCDERDPDNGKAEQQARLRIDPTSTESSRVAFPLWPLNEELEKLRCILQRTKGQTCFDDLKQSDKELLSRCCELVDLFLWKVSLHETQQVEVAASAVTETRRALFAELKLAANGDLPRKFFCRLKLRLLPPRSWLYLRVQEKLNELHAACGPLLNSMRHERLAAPAYLCRDPDLMRAQLKETCPWRTLNRKAKPDHSGKTRQITDWHPETLCRRACDVLLMWELCFRLREISEVLGLGTSTIQKTLMACAAAWNDLRRKAPASAGINQQSKQLKP